jgi:ribonuclease HI
MQYAIKLSAYPDNPTFQCAFKPQFENLYEAKEKAIRSFGLRIKPLLQEAEFEIDNIIGESFPDTPPWTHTPPNINFDLSILKKSETAEDIYVSKFLEFKEKYPNHHHVYTDGSKADEGVSAAAVSGRRKISEAYNKDNSIFSAELRAIELALNHIQNSRHYNYIIFSDSKSSLQALQNLWSHHPLVCRVLDAHTELCHANKNIIFCWIPSHVGIRGNEAADRAAKDALDLPVSSVMVPVSDCKPKAAKYINSVITRNWDEIDNNKLKEKFPDLKEHFQPNCPSRRDEVVLTRLRIGHSRLTHQFIFDKDMPPVCVGCDAPYTIKHILLECIDFSEIRKKYYTCQDLHTLFTVVKTQNLLQFIQEIGLYRKL